MSMHLQQEIEHLQNKLLNLVATAKAAVEKSVKSVDDRDAATAQAVVDGDFAIDRAEVDLEEDCLKILALYQPVATNLRVIVSVMKINNEIERIGDLAVNIAERALFLCSKGPVEAPSDLAEMRAKALAMLTRSLDALVRMDTQCAREVRASDDEVDALNRKLFQEFAAAVRRNPDHVECLLSYLSVGRHLERIADYATNIAEDVIYLMEGDIVRHRPTLPEARDPTTLLSQRPPMPGHHAIELPTGPSRKTLCSLDWLNFLLADVQQALRIEVLSFDLMGKLRHLD